MSKKLGNTLIALLILGNIFLLTIVFGIKYMELNEAAKHKPKPYMISCSTLIERVQNLEGLALGLSVGGDADHDAKEFAKYAEEDKKLPCRGYNPWTGETHD